ncbi:aromatic amino acid beta-eliminating lyase/threonine aldolase, partial [Microbacterium laevaniformans OR221]
MRQAGILAAAAELALTEQVARLAEDHANAKALAEGLSQLDELALDMSQVQTNMVFATLADAVDIEALVKGL